MKIMVAFGFVLEESVTVKSWLKLSFRSLPNSSLAYGDDDAVATLLDLCKNSTADWKHLHVVANCYCSYCSSIYHYLQGPSIHSF